ncbi:helix-turn-helix transcriptional regulator [Streptomyces aidingensis]|uniref:Predicted DNA-binding transcriptional regulator YafY, contains an HTH and WYL domains n=1 Tax=Streptomyces aidingensis TaxID=910347 RepID=A0A1I1RYT6_9ACTN|nr:WYL domain-containing protein [Streptomyces aidingensis]SFD39476.1 Predicted DNA-binding transcriptional regulator YafY, contains an HTH and WYL domains [Streptomyces aidingensis]
MAIAKAERLMNLALCLRGTARPLTKRELRTSIEAYIEAGSEDAFNRMFERDKDDLRELGMVIDTVESLDGEVGYMARRDSNRLPPITLDVAESAALSLAARVWQQARLAGAASGALQKLRAAGMPLADDGQERTHALEPRVPAGEAAFEPLMLACRDRRPVTFGYRKSNAVRAETRQVEPWALECWRGHWYLAGWDRDRGDKRVFRLSRIDGKVRSRSGSFTVPVPGQVAVREAVAAWAGENATDRARIRLRSGSGYPLRARALSCRALDAEWDELEIPYGHGLGSWLAEFGPDVLVLDPAELRADVVERLRAVAKG